MSTKSAVYKWLPLKSNHRHTGSAILWNTMLKRFDLIFASCSLCILTDYYNIHLLLHYQLQYGHQQGFFKDREEELFLNEYRPQK